MGKQRKKSLQELMQERATGTGNQSVYTTEPRKTYNTSVKSQVDKLYKRNEPQSFSNKVMNRYNEIKNTGVGFTARSFGVGALTGTAGVLQGVATDVASQMQKGEEKKTIDNVTDLIKAVSNLTNQQTARTEGLRDIVKSTAEIFKDKDKSVQEKLSQAMSNVTSGVDNMLLPRKRNNK